MNIEDYKCKVIEKTILICDGDGLEVYQCDECKGDYFQAGNTIYCIPDGRHLCENCFEDWIEEQDSELNAKQQLKQGEI